MVRRLLGLLVLCGGCLDTNPKFVEPGESDATGPVTGSPGETTDTQPVETATDSAPPTTTTGMVTTPETISSTSVESACGDGEIDPGEECDDGDDDDLDECNNACVTTVCGDGVIQDGEQCDDGNVSDDDDCLTGCTKATCGDGKVHGMLEMCDDGDQDDTDECVQCLDAVCGDGWLHVGVEGCDDGNAVEFDGCQGDCTVSPKLVFITSKSFTADLGGLDGADFKCQELALAADIPGEFRAWLGSIEGGPLTRMEPSALPYALRDGTVVASDWGDLVDGSLQAPIDQTEKGGKPLPAKGACKPSSVFTNTFPDGMAGFLMDDCGNWGLTEGPTLFGDSLAADKAWTQDCNAVGCQAEAPIYCVQQ